MPGCSLLSIVWGGPSHLSRRFAMGLALHFIGFPSALSPRALRNQFYLEFHKGLGSELAVAHWSLLGSHLLPLLSAHTLGSEFLRQAHCLSCTLSSYTISESRVPLTPLSWVEVQS